MKLVLPTKDTVSFLIIAFTTLIFFELLFGFVLNVGFNRHLTKLPPILFKSDHPEKYWEYIALQSIVLIACILLYLIIRKYGKVIKWGKQKKETIKIPIDRKKLALSKKRKWWFW